MEPLKPFNLYEAMSGGQNLAMNRVKLDEAQNTLQARAGLQQAVSAGTPEALENYRKRFPMEAMGYEQKLFERQKGIREQTKFSDEQRKANTEWLVGATDQLLSPDLDDQSRTTLAQSLIQEGKRRSIIGSDFEMSQGLDINEIKQINQRAKVALGTLPDPGALEKTVGADGKPVFTRRSQAVGQQPYVSEGKDRGDYVLPVQTGDQIYGWNTRNSKAPLFDPVTGEPVRRPVVGSASDPNLQRDIAGAKEIGKSVGEQVGMIGGKYDALDSVKDAKAMLEKGIYSGYWAETQSMLAKATPGIDKTRAANTEQFIAYIGNTVVPRLKEFGGNDSNEEMRYLQGIMGGNIKMEEGAIRKILESSERKIKAGIDRLRKQAKNIGQETPEPPQKPTTGPAVGTVVNGYIFKGGNPNDKNSWERQ